MKMFVKGITYAGSWRGFGDDTDNVAFLATVVYKNEQELVDFLLDNLSYGNDEDGIKTIDQLVKELIDGNVPINDGCGTIISLIDEKGVVLFDILRDTEDMFDADEVSKLKYVALKYDVFTGQFITDLL